MRRKPSRTAIYLSGTFWASKDKSTVPPARTSESHSKKTPISWVTATIFIGLWVVGATFGGYSKGHDQDSYCPIGSGPLKECD